MWATCHRRCLPLRRKGSRSKPEVEGLSGRVMNLTVRMYVRVVNAECEAFCGGIVLYM